MSIHTISKLLKEPPTNSMPQRLQQQLAFILEIDKLKSIMRQSPILNKTRTENDAEHSWHLAMIAVVLSEYADPEVNINRVIKMLLVHDVVEIDAGDTFLYDESAFSDSKAEREMKAAERIYGILPKDTGTELFDLWKEFEARNTPDAMFASALDRLQPLLVNYFTDGGTWKKFGIAVKQVMAKKSLIADASEPLWQLAESLILDAKEKGYLV